MQGKTIRAIIRFLFEHFSRLEITGLENVPTQGGCILAVNHLGRLDPALVYAFLDREDVTSLVADKYLHHPFFSWLVNSLNGIWIHREDADFTALRAARNYLVSGGALGIAPEGTRSHTGALIAAKTGVAYLADKAGVPIVPVAVSGTEKATQELLRLRRPLLKARFGKPLRLPPLERGDRAAALQRNTDEIMCRIAAMLPPEYRGVYADHPRMKELLAA